MVAESGAGLFECHRIVNVDLTLGEAKMGLRSRWITLAAAWTLAVGSAPGAFAADNSAADLEKIDHVIIIYLENWSFDSLFFDFPGADSGGSATSINPQVDATGHPYVTLPPVLNAGKPDPRFPTPLPNAPFDFGDHGIGLTDFIGDLVHRFYQEQKQINGGRMDQFAQVSDAGGETMGYFGVGTMGSTFLWQLAQDYTLADAFFHPAFGGSFLNHQWLVCACTPTYPNAPAGLQAVLDAQGNLVKDGSVTPDFYAVNTIRSVYLHAPTDTDTTKLLPSQNQVTIGDLLDREEVSWAWYAGGYDDAVAGHPDPLFQFHHQPFAMYKANAPASVSASNSVAGTAKTEHHRVKHLKDFKQLYDAIDNGTLEKVVWYKPLGEFNQHPGYATLKAGDDHVREVMGHVMNSPIWKSSLVIITWDENGGFWDHVAPPSDTKRHIADRWGPGSRVPAILVSPFARHGYVDHQTYDQTAILKLIEDRFELPRLGTRDAAQPDLWRSLNLGD
jgi:phospholipase C